MAERVRHLILARFCNGLAAKGEARGAAERADRIWPLLGGGCYCNRDTERSIGNAGFRIERCQRFDFRPGPLLVMVSAIILGAAVRP